MGTVEGGGIAEGGALKLRGCLGSGVRALDGEMNWGRRAFFGVEEAAIEAFELPASAAARASAKLPDTNLLKKLDSASSTTGANWSHNSRTRGCRHLKIFANCKPELSKFYTGSIISKENTIESFDNNKFK